MVYQLQKVLHDELPNELHTYLHWNKTLESGPVGVVVTRGFKDGGRLMGSYRLAQAQVGKSTEGFPTRTWEDPRCKGRK